MSTTLAHDEVHMMSINGHYALAHHNNHKGIGTMYLTFFAHYMFFCGRYDDSWAFVLFKPGLQCGLL
jgi:hypothetical protein